MTIDRPRPHPVIDTLRDKKVRGEAIVMVTAYDVPSAQAAELGGVDLILVGDSAAMTVLGYETTQLVSVDEMLMLTRAARRGAPATAIVGDLPFGSYEASDALALETARRFIEAGCDAVKMEGDGPIVDRARCLVGAGIRVMGHVGLTPQQADAREGFRVHGRTAEAALEVIDGAVRLEAAGCFAIVAEAVPAAVARELSPRLRVPVIGIGAGGGTDGQVLVFNDLVGLYDRHVPRFVKQYATLKREMISAVSRYAADVRARLFPEGEHEYRMEDSEAHRLREMLATSLRDPLR